MARIAPIAATVRLPLRGALVLLAAVAASPAGTAATFVPSNLPAAVCRPPVGESLLVSGGATMLFDTGVAAACDRILVPPDGGPEICVHEVDDVLVTAGSTLRVEGFRSLALVARTTMTIHGIVDASADGIVLDGPGGFASGFGTGEIGEVSAGGGGAGHGTAGGSGGGLVADRGAGGAEYGDPTVVPLLGGSRGGRGGSVVPDGSAAAGRAGGALQLVGCESIVLAVTAVVDAGGGGGAGGASGDSGDIPPHGGGGGGSGGGVLLEGDIVMISGIVVANGGGGGGGGSDEASGPAVAGSPGSDGPRSATQALGGVGGGAAGGGGHGGSLAGVAQPGVSPEPASGAGGGGGAAGRIRVASCQGTTLGAFAVLSPAPVLASRCPLLSSGFETGLAGWTVSPSA